MVLNEWNKNLRYYMRKIEKKTADLKIRFLREIDKANKQLKIYEILIKYIYNKKEEDMMMTDQDNALIKIKEILNS
jgi:hypothetical protein